MATQPAITYGLEKLFLFRYYGTREEYAAVIGHEPPPFDPTKPPKYWFDPAALSTGRRNVVYDNVIALDMNGHPLRSPEGKPVLEPIMLPSAQAAAVNIPEHKGTNEPGTDQLPIPMPINEPPEGDELFFDIMGNVSVRNIKLWQDAANRGAFSQTDRELLRAIARKLGVPVQE
jgi:hypothetical protein